MKIACQSCQAKYTIADDKVLGRVVKIRCKKCGATIVINGNEASGAGSAANEEAQAPNSRAFDYAAAPQNEEPWTVNVADGDQRTLTTAEVVAQFKAGVVNDETYCWKDGMADWLPLREIESLSSACGIGAPPAPVAPAPAPRAAPVQPAYTAPAPVQAAAGGSGSLGALFGGGETASFGSQGAAEANGRQAAQPSPAARRAGGRAGAADLFGTAAEAGGENDVMTSAPRGAPAMHEADAKLTGQRNENSVLFSLNALTQNAPKVETPGPQGDGSGLIDIRALSANMAPQGKKATHVDDIMNLGGGGAFSAALAAPVLAPPLADGGDSYGSAAAPTSKSNKMMFALIGLGALIVVLLVVVLLKPKGDSSAATAPSPSASTPAGAMAANETAAPASTASAASDPATTGAGPGAAPVDPTKGSQSSGATSAPVRAAGHPNAANPSPAAAAPATPPAPATPAMPAAPAAPTDFNSVLAGAAGVHAPAAAAPATQTSSAPFDRGAAAGALGAVNVAGCKRPDGPTGSGHVSVTFAPDGTVSNATADQPPFQGTPVGGCVAGKFRGAHIPAFGGGPVKVGKSFTIN
jgi:predicted Zn finger-like uncharacterized protein